MVGCLIYQDENFLHAYEIAEPRIIIGRAPKDGVQRSAEVGTFFIPLSGPAISSQHLEIKFEAEKITITDTSRAGTTVKCGGVTKMLLKNSYELDATKTDRFQVICESKAIIFKVVVVVKEQEETAPAVVLADNQEREEEAINQVVQEPVKKKAPAKKKEAGESKNQAPTKEQRTKKESANTKKAVKPKSDAKKKTKKVTASDELDDESVRPSTNESFQEFINEDSDTDGDEDLSLKDTSSESDDKGEEPEVSDPNESLAVDSCLIGGEDAPSMAYNIDDYTTRRSLMHVASYDDCSFADILDNLGPNMKICWCNYLHNDMKSIVEELNVRQDEGYAAEKVDVFFTNRFRRTARYLMAIHRGIPILTDTYLQRCRKTVLIDARVEFPRARKYLLNVSKEEAAANDQSFLSRVQSNWSLARVTARSFKYPIVFVDSYHIIITPESILNAPITKQTFAKDFVALYSFGLLVANMGVKTTKIVFESEFDKYIHSREIEEDLPELNKTVCRSLNPDLSKDTLDDRILSAASAAKESNGHITIIVPPPDSPHYEKYKKFKGLYKDTGLTFIQMKRQGVVNSILLGEPVFREQYIE